MIDLLADCARWLSEGRRVALATIVSVEGSAPRAAGAHMAIDQLGHISGSLSSGCVESDVVVRALDVLGGAEPQLVSYGADEDELGVGLTCGGTIEVLIRELRG